MEKQDIEKIKSALKGKHIFIAYIEEDKEVAHMIWDKLNEFEAIPWAYTKNDDNIRWRNEIVRTIRNSDVMILVFSKNTDDKANKQIVKEIGLASKYNVEIIPFMIDDIEDIKNEALAYELEGINWVRKTDPLERQINLLLVRLVKYFGKSIGINSGHHKYQWKGWKLWIVSTITVFILIAAVYMFLNKDHSNSNKKVELKNYVCYNNKIRKDSRTEYVGCDLYEKPCAMYNKKHFGHYASEHEAHLALTRCIKSEPIISIAKSEINNFITAYYKASEDPIHISKVLSFFSDVLDKYFESTKIPKETILDRLIAYNYKYPDRNYTIKKVDILNISRNHANILVTLHWWKKDKSGEKHSGVSIQKIKLVKTKGKLFIKSIDNQLDLPTNANNQTINNNLPQTNNTRQAVSIESYQINKTHKNISSNLIFDYKKDALPSKIKFDPNKPEKFIFFAVDRDSLHILRNLPFAIHGYRFKTNFIYNYYKKMPWYHPDDTQKHIVLNTTEEEWLKSIEELKIKILRNLPFAFNGVVFRKDKRLDLFFRQFDWYNPNKDYIPVVQKLSDEDKNWIEKIKRRRRISYNDFFNLFNYYIKNNMSSRDYH